MATFTNLPDAAHQFRLVVDSVSRRGNVKRTCKILQTRDDKYALVYQSQQVAITQATVDSLLKLLATINISQVPALSGGLDGTDYQLTIGSHASSVTFTWWSDQVDENWQPLIELREKMYQLCRENFGEFS